MLITHSFWMCLNCGNVVEVTDEMLNYAVVSCELCGYELEMDDPRFEIKEVEF